MTDILKYLQNRCNHYATHDQHATEPSLVLGLPPALALSIKWTLCLSCVCPITWP